MDNQALYINNIHKNKSINICQNTDLLNRSNISTNSLIISSYNNAENLLFYNIFDNNIFQLSYNIKEDNGLYKNSRNFIELNIDNYSIKTVNNKLYYNINSIPYSTTSFNGILYIDNNYITNYISINNNIVSQLNLYNNILTYYIFKLNTIKDHINYYNKLKVIIDNNAGNLSFSDIFFKDNILSIDKKLNTIDEGFKKQTISWDDSDNDPDIINENYEGNPTQYTYFDNIKLNTYKSTFEYISYLSLNNIKIQYRNKYYINNELIDNNYSEYFWETIYPNDIIYTKQLNNLEFRIFTNYYNDNDIYNKYNDNINYELNSKLISDNNIYMQMESKNGLSFINNVYKNTIDNTYVNYSILGIISYNNFNFKNVKQIEYDIIPNKSYFTYQYKEIIINNDETIYDISTDSLITNNETTIHYYTESDNKITINYDNHTEYSYVNIINIPNESSYFMIYDSNEDLNEKTVSKYLFNILSNKKCIMYNKDDINYLFYGYNYIYDNKSKQYHKDYDYLINKTITPLNYAILSNDILKLSHIISDNLLVHKISDIKYNSITEQKSSYICNLIKNNNNYKINNIVKIKI